MKKKPGTKLACGDCLERLKDLPDDSVDTVITDPPYGLSAPPDLHEVLSKWMAGDEYEHKSKGFMGAEWDSFVPGPRVWKEVYRVLKPGGTALVFAGTRTVDLMGISLRLSGLIFRDTIMYLFGTGFPKSYNISKGLDKYFGAERKVVGKKKGVGGNTGSSRYNWNSPNDQVDRREYDDTLDATVEAQQWHGWSSSLKPAYEPVLVFQKPLDGTYVENALKHGVAGFNIEECRIEGQPRTTHAEGNCVTTVAASGHLKGKKPHGPEAPPSGRWPANLILDEEAGEMLDEQSGSRRSSGVYKANDNNPTRENYVTSFSGRATPATQYSDSGGASRFFYCAKASKRERNAGLDGLPEVEYSTGCGGGDMPIDDTGRQRNRFAAVAKNHHTTVKPISLMRYLARLTKTPTGGVVLDPFMGSGSTGVACMLEGRNFIGIELDKEYYQIAKKRIKYAKEHPEEFDPDRKPKKAAKNEKTEKGLWDSLNEDKNG